MSYTVLARRYRSGTFDEVIGQNHVAQTLKKAIESGRIAHAYLFCGTRGVGKTSMARILAKALNCEKAKGPTAEPCGKCGSCQGIARGDDIDVIEIDAASNTQVDKTREVIIENAAYRPARSRFKIYIIDEAHMLSKASFNALLKTLEEPPEHVRFILATTEPEKLLPTILSRCQRYDFRNIPTREIATHLKDICQKEKIKADEDALLLVAKAGAGSMRDALSLLDRLLSIGEKQLNVEMIEQLLGMPKVQLLYDLAQSIGEADVAKTLSQVDAMITAGMSADALIAALVDHLRNLLILRTCGAESQLVEVPGLSPKQLNEQAAKFEATVLSQDIVILEELRRQMRSSQAGRALLDATMVRLALAEQFTAVEDLLGQINGGDAGTAQKKKHLIPVEAGEIRNEATPEPDDSDDDLPQVGRVWEGEKKSLSAAFAAHSKRSVPPLPPATAMAPTNIQSNLQPVASGDVKEIWQNLLGRLGPGLKSQLSLARLQRVEDDQVIIRFSHQGETFSRMIEKNGNKDHLRNAMKDVLGRPVALSIEVDPPPAESPASAAPATPVRRETPKPAPELPAHPVQPVLTPELRQQVAQDPLVKAILQELGGQIVRVEQ